MLGNDASAQAETTKQYYRVRATQNSRVQGRAQERLRMLRSYLKFDW